MPYFLSKLQIQYCVKHTYKWQTVNGNTFLSMRWYNVKQKAAQWKAPGAGAGSAIGLL